MMTLAASAAIELTRRFNRRYATKFVSRIIRGLKPTAKFILPLRGNSRLFNNYPSGLLSVCGEIEQTDIFIADGEVCFPGFDNGWPTVADQD